MEDDDYPNFANAFPVTSTEEPTASWHPALRPDSEAGDSDDDFFDRYPSATPKKSQLHYVESATDTQPPVVDDTNEESIIPRAGDEESTIVAEHTVDESTGIGPSQPISELPADALAIGFSEQVASSYVSHGQQQDEDAAIFRPDETVEEQERDLEDLMLKPSGSEIVGLDREVDAEDPLPEEHYEHQGEITAMEQAQELSAEAPLLSDAAPAPTPGQVDNDPFTGLGREAGFDSPLETQQALSAKQPIPGHLDRSFTTNFTDSVLPEQVESQSKRPLSVDWPDVGDDKTFGEILDQQYSQAELQTLGETAAEEAVLEAAPDLLPDEDFLPDDGDEMDLTAAWQAALDDDELLVEDSNGFDPSEIFGDDDGNFLDDQPLDTSTLSPDRSEKSQATPSGPDTVASGSRPTMYGAPGQQSFSSFHGRSSETPQTGLYDIYNQPGVTQPPKVPISSTAQSFVDKAKGGYQSPYDLPMEVVKPRKRPQALQQQSSGLPSAPPPRTSSFSTQEQPTGLASPGPPPASNLSPPGSRQSAVPPKSITRPGAQADGGFFAELPMTTKPRTRPSGLYTPHSAGVPTPPPSSIAAAQQQALPTPPMSAQALQMPPQPLTPQFQQNTMYGGLRQPERLPLLPDDSAPTMITGQTAQSLPPTTRYSPNSQSTLAPSLAPLTNRYSPAPVSAPQAPSAARYSPAPGTQPAQARNRYTSASSVAVPPSIQGSHAFAPRTSSPLAYHTDKPQPELPAEGAQLFSASPSKLSGSATEQNGDLRYGPIDLAQSASQMSHSGAPPPRARTQSPTAIANAAVARQDRPSSTGVSRTQPGVEQPKRPVLPHRRQFSRELLFAAPQNESSQDPLERWKGRPIFQWSASGSIIKSFPKQIPFYASGQQLPSVKCTPGSITVQDVMAFMPMDQLNAKFPGPLPARSKGKKKDILAWMNEKIESLERKTASALVDFSLASDIKNRIEEKLVLWKIVRIYVEHDGVLEGNPKIEEEVRKILLPNLAQMGQVVDLHSPAPTTLTSDVVDRQVLFQLRQALLEGQRERAVWLAEENKLWGHAMLIASTMGPDTWKQIVQSFVRSQVKSVGSDARSMAALYQVFAGNSEECIDELVPPSARAGFQMISKSDGSVSGNPLEGLDQWRETLGLVTSNRTAADGPSLVALGKLLGGYGRAEAAHTCFLFARSFAKHTGADDAEANFVLLGTNHLPQDQNFGQDLDSILLTEVYEYASSLSAPSTAVAYIPHLQSYKLIHAQELAAYGLKSKAQSYCDHITSAYTSTTRPSQYYHPTFTQSVAELSAFLSQTPHDGKSGFLSKPALNKVTSSAGSWFSKFVSGDDDQESNGSGPGGTSDDMAGPFGRVSGESPSLSREASGTDLYSSMMAGGVPIPGVAPTSGLQTFAPSSAPGRYAPSSSHSNQAGSRYAPTSAFSGSSAEQLRPSSARYHPTSSGMSTLSQSPPAGMHYAPIPAGSRRTSGQEGGGYAPVPGDSRRSSAHGMSPVASYEPRTAFAEDRPSSGYSAQSPTHLQPTIEEQTQKGSLASGLLSNETALPGSALAASVDAGEGYQPTSSSYEPPTGGYEPPSSSYQPYEPEPDDQEDDKPKQKKKMFGDDDDDDRIYAKSTTAASKAQADREADDAFRKAAEADAARDKLGGEQKKGWFGWFGGKRDASAIPGPIRAKLGDESSFVYDETLKKWVNKKGGSEASTPAAPTPPPPRGPPSRVASGSSSVGGPPPGAPSAIPSNFVDSRPPTSGSGPSFAAPSSGPPSRTGTPASNPMMPPLPAGVNGGLNGPPSRPSTGMSNASSLDDLLAGPPGGRKAGTVKGKKKGGRYVDVMAK